MPQLSSTETLIVFLALLLTGVGLVAFVPSETNSIIGFSLIGAALTVVGVKGATGAANKLTKKKDDEP